MVNIFSTKKSSSVISDTEIYQWKIRHNKFKTRKAFNLKKGLANKDFQETKSHNNFTSNSHNEKLNNSKSETNCTDDVHINNRQSYDHVKLCRPKSINCPSKSNSGHENIHTNNSKNK